MSSSPAKPARYLAHEPGHTDDVKPPAPRSFGLLVGGVLFVLGTVAWWRVHGWGLWLAGLGAVLLVLAWLAPDRLATLNRAWFRFGLLLHRVVSPLTLWLVFVLGVCPTAILARALRRGHFPLRPDAACPTYWRTVTPGENTLRLSKQY